MRSVVFLSALSCASLLAEEPVSKVAFTESKSSVRAFTPYDETTLPVVRVRLEIHTSGGKRSAATSSLSMTPRAVTISGALPF